MQGGEKKRSIFSFRRKKDTSYAPLSLNRQPSSPVEDHRRERRSVEFKGEVSGSNVRDETGQTPLHFAASAGHVEIIRLLLDDGASPMSEDHCAVTPAHRAARLQNADCLRELLDRWQEEGVKVGKEGRGLLKDQCGDTPLHEAAGYGSRPCVKLLLSRGWGATVTNSRKETPVHRAASADHVATLDSLLYSFEGPKAVWVRDSRGHTPMDVALQYKNQSCVERLAEFMSGLEEEAASQPGPVVSLTQLGLFNNIKGGNHSQHVTDTSRAEEKPQDAQNAIVDTSGNAAAVAVAPPDSRKSSLNTDLLILDSVDQWPGNDAGALGNQRKTSVTSVGDGGSRRVSAEIGELMVFEDMSQLNQFSGTGSGQAPRPYSANPWDQPTTSHNPTSSNPPVLATTPSFLPPSTPPHPTTSTNESNMGQNAFSPFN